jgi:hypothetical protein
MIRQNEQPFFSPDKTREDPFKDFMGKKLKSAMVIAPQPTL